MPANRRPVQTTEVEETCRFLPWDSQFFRCRIGQVQGHRLTEKKLENIQKWAIQEQMDCIYFLSDVNDRQTIRLAEDFGFRLVDLRITLQCSLAHWNPPAEHAGRIHIRPALAADIPLLEKIAGESHEKTRFFFDERFPTSSSQALYQTWIRNSCEGFADCVMIAEAGTGQTAGYITCHLPSAGADARIGLVGVAPGSRGARVGYNLVNAALDWFVQKKQEMVFVSTQSNNIAAQRLYQNCGFQTHSVNIWYHKWFTGCIPDPRKS